MTFNKFVFSGLSSFVVKVTFDRFFMRNYLRLLTHVEFFFRKHGLILSEVFWYMERSKNFEEKYFIAVQKIHLPEKV